jgi:hypothetical protein
MGPAGALVAGVLCQFILGSLFGAVILRAACSWYNWMVGRKRTQPIAALSQTVPEQFPAADDNPYAASVVQPQAGDDPTVGVPEPSFGQAWLISFVTILVNAIVGFIVGLAVGAGVEAAGADGASLGKVALLVSIPVSFLVFAGMLTAMLPTSFGRALIVTLLYLAVSLLIAVVIGGIAFIVMFFLMNR